MNQTPTWLRRFTIFVAASTLFLIFAGAMVTSTGSGLAVPDWPLSYGMVMPPMVGGIFYEHGHRMIAATVGFLTVLQAIWLQLREPKRRVRILGWCSVGAVIAQGILGGLTVILLLPHATSIGHAALGEIFLCLNVSIAFFTSAPAALAGVRRYTWLPVVVYAQILLGAVMRHLQAGLAIPDFPLSFGRVVPPFTSAAVVANFAHRVGALAVTLAVLAVLISAFKTRHLRGFAVLLAAIVSLQIVLGAYVVWSGNASFYHSNEAGRALTHAVITSFHVVTGAATLATSLLIALAARTFAPKRAPEQAGAFVASGAAA